MITNHSINVIYLCYIPYGLQSCIDFIQSYKQFEAGISHDLIIVFKGQKTLDETLPFVEVLQQNNIIFQQLIYTGTELDIGTYFWATRQLQCEAVFFLNTQSTILADNWLNAFFHATKNNPKTIFSATGSWQSLVTTLFHFHRADALIKKPFSLKRILSNIQSQVKTATIWWYQFPLFPNPHIRTNAFYINRQLFLSLQKKPIINKEQAFRFESGRNSFTAQLKKRDYKVAIISKNGQSFQEEMWPESKIFYAYNQENLLISDNQTKAYDKSQEPKKSFLRKIVWG